MILRVARLRRVPPRSCRRRRRSPTRAATRRRRSSSASTSRSAASGAKRSTAGRKPTELDPTYAAAFNDLAIAYEHEGQLDKARKAYEKALELEPNNAQIRQNYELFKEINDRTGSQGKEPVGSRSALVGGAACAALIAGLRPELLRDPDRNADPAEAGRLARSSACSSPASSPAAPRTSTPTRKRSACCAASCARSRRSRSSTPTSCRCIDIAQDQSADADRRRRRRDDATSRARPPISAARASQTLALPKNIKEEKDLEPYERLFANIAYWKRIGEEFQNPLIVTGTVLFTPHRRSGFVQRDQEVFDSLGRRRVVPVRTYMERKGFILRPKFVFIDGRTGATMYSESYREEILYNAQQNTPALSSYFELMDRLVPNFLSALSSQKIRGTARPAASRPQAVDQWSATRS